MIDHDDLDSLYQQAPMPTSWAERDAYLAAVDAEAAPVPSRPFERCLLGDMMAAGPSVPTMVHTWLYAGELTTIQAEPGVGKSWVALWVASHLIAAGRDVVYLDEEGGPDVIVERLIALGCEPAGVDAHLWYFPFPGRRWDDADVSAFAEMVGGVADLAAVVVDSMADFLAMAQLSEDSGRDVTLFCDRILGTVRTAGAALLILDHLTKPDGDAQRRTKSRYARGSGAKLAKASLAILLEVERDFDRTHSGALRAWKTKDRRGAVELPTLDRPPLVLEVVVTGSALSIAETVREGPEPTPWEGPTRAMSACRDWLKCHPGQSFTQRQITDQVIDTTTRRGFRAQTIREALGALSNTDAEIEIIEGPRRSWLYAWAAEALDSAGDEF